ncbi:hypothetical protein [Streptomyces sp. KLOTTS4A1]|uniref:hypothetical protein n=1 Tax=Streptomyces sp. KLOTTS4A1 TaxID=3390996 RepID=UPI0039F5A0F8
MTHENPHAPNAGRPRILPWSSADGKMCFLVTDATGTSRLSRIADRVESVQLDMADDILVHAGDLMNDSKATASQLRFVATCLMQALHDVRRIAHSRGTRLPIHDSDN